MSNEFILVLPLTTEVPRGVNEITFIINGFLYPEDVLSRELDSRLRIDIHKIEISKRTQCLIQLADGRQGVVIEFKCRMSPKFWNTESIPTGIGVIFRLI